MIYARMEITNEDGYVDTYFVKGKDYVSMDFCKELDYILSEYEEENDIDTDVQEVDYCLIEIDEDEYLINTARKEWILSKCEECAYCTCYVQYGEDQTIEYKSPFSYCLHLDTNVPTKSTACGYFKEWKETKKA